MRHVPIYTHPAAGWRALTSSARKLLDYRAFARGSVSVFNSNQPKGGFDCPGCAWPDHKTHKTIDVCETGIKALASETMTIKADSDFFAKHSVTQLQTWSGYELEHAGRLSQPLYYDNNRDRYLPISWSDAYQLISQKLKQLDSPNEAMFYTSGRLTNEPAFLYQLMVRCFGTNNLPDCSNMCHEPTSVMLARQLGIGKSTVVLEDFEQAELILMFGQNPATNHPRMLEMLAYAHQQGCRIIAINPMREKGLSKFRNPQKPTHMVAGKSDPMVDEVVQIQIGGDVALLTGIAKWLIENDAIDNQFIEEHTSGYSSFKTWVIEQSWEDIKTGCGIDQQAIVELAKLVAQSKATICTWGMGITQHVQGDDNVAMITNLLLLMGMIGITGGGASPVRGHSNVQGDRTMGIHESPKQELLDSLEATFNRPMPQKHGYNVVEGAKALIDSKIKVFMSMGGNYSVAAPDTTAIQTALQNNKLNVFVATKLNETMLYPGESNLILPCLSRTERVMTSKGEQFTTVEDSICQIVPSRGQLKPISAHLKAEAQIVAELAMHLFENDTNSAKHSLTANSKCDSDSDCDNSSDSIEIPWAQLGEDYDLIRDYIAKAIDGFEDFNKRIRSHERGFHLYHSARHREWHTQSGKAQFELPKYPIIYSSATLKQESIANQSFKNDNVSTFDATLSNTLDHEATSTEPQHTSINDQAWQLTSVRSHDQFNTIIFGYNDRYRNTNRRDVLFMHPDEMQRLGWQQGDKVMVSRVDSHGKQRKLGPLVLTPMDIAANAVATYYPECNDFMDLGSHSLESHTPSYKSVAVYLNRLTAAIKVVSVP